MKQLCLIVAALALVMSGCTHTLGVYSDPSGAEVLIDGESIGETTPAELPIKDLEYGTSIVSVRKSGYRMTSRPEELSVKFRKGLAVSSVLFFYTPFPWIKVLQTGYKGVTEPRGRSFPLFHLEPVKADFAGPLDFESAVRRASEQLFAQISNRLAGVEETATVRVVTDPVIDSNTGEVTNISARIHEVMNDEARWRFPQFEIAEMDSRNIDQADYVIVGIMPLEPYGGGTGKLRHLYLSALDRYSGRIVAHSEVWMADTGLRFESTPIFQDSPMYLKDQRVEALIATARARAGSNANREYFDSLKTNALLGEASKAYDRGDYRRALALFMEAAQRADGQVMRTFSGLYQTFFKLGEEAEAEGAFASLADLGIKNGNLGVKFLFNVDATAFAGDSEEQRKYGIWLRQIARTIVASRNCVVIVGHASNSGTRPHNLILSRRRAELVRDRMHDTAEGVYEKTTAVGRAFDENIIGTGANDETDLIDRRVEFKLSRCGA